MRSMLTKMNFSNYKNRLVCFKGRIKNYNNVRHVKVHSNSYKMYFRRTMSYKIRSMIFRRKTIALNLKQKLKLVIYSSSFSNFKS